MIFLGTVTEVTRERFFRMRIDKAYKGLKEKSVLLYDDGMCDGPSLHVGEQYLMYTHDDGFGFLPARGCTRSRSVRYAKEDLAFLNSLSKAPPTSKVFGQVTTTRLGSIDEEGKPAPRVVVEIRGVGKARKSTTDLAGRYSFSGLAPGFYSVNAILTGFTQSALDDDPVEVIARGCEVVDVVLRKNWNGTLAGHVTRADGSPGPAGMNLDLIRVDSDTGHPELLIGFTVRTDDRGEYSFHGVAPGLYKVVLNIYNHRLQSLHTERSTGRQRRQKRLLPPSRLTKRVLRNVTSTYRLH